MSEPQHTPANPTTAASAADKWTEQELLPEWSEKFYDVWTAKKHGKWVMLKTLKPEFRDSAEHRAMIEKEFDVRYNLAHPNIVMINDFEDVPGIGRAIITDDVYGQSLRKILDSGHATEETLNKIVTSLVDALEYIQRNHIVHHRIRPETIIFTENIGNLKLIDVGFDQLDHLSHNDTARDIRSFGEVLSQVLYALPTRHPHLEHVVQKAKNGGYRDIQDLKMALSNRSSRRIYILAISFLTVMAALLAWLLSHPNTTI